MVCRWFVAFSLLVCACSDKSLLPDNQIDDKFPEHFGPTIFDNPQNPSTPAGVELGRFLFYEKRLSSNDSVSCATCHRQEKAFSDGRPLAVGVMGRVGSRNTMALSNLLWSSRLHWDGKFETLEEQVLHPITNPLEMNLSIEAAVSKLRAIRLYPPKFKDAFGDTAINASRIAKALAQFTRSLISSSSRYDLFLQKRTSLTASEDSGRMLFFTHPIAEIGLRGGNCGDCHIGALVGGDPFEFRGFHNNGLDSDENMQPGLSAITGKPSDKGKFKAPSLRNIALTAPYMHDGRFKTLEEVLEHYDKHIVMSSTLSPLIIEASNGLRSHPKEPISLQLTPREKQLIIEFLYTLTDTKFIADKRFSDPFTQ